MSTIEQLHARTIEFLKRPPNDLPVEVSPQTTLEALGTSEPVTRKFVIFLPDHLEHALDLASRFMELANDNPGEAGLEAVLGEAERVAEQESIEMVKYALMVFITHHPEGRLLPIPPLEERSPELIVPSEGEVAQRGLEALGALGPEAQLDYFREDTVVNDHHNKWHVVYPFTGHPDPDDPFGPNITKDRQGELFWYMHQQMLARYDTERRWFGLPLVEPFSDYRLAIPEGYEPNIAGFSDRPPNTSLVDFVRNGFRYRVSDHESRRDRLIDAAREGSFVKDGVKVPLTPSLLGDTMESNVDSVDKPNAPRPLSFYGNHHNFGHVLIGNVPVADGGVMLGTDTAVRDPIFFRWHRHVDDTFFIWQRDKLSPNNFETDVPPVRLRKGLNGASPENQSPDIFLCLASSIPGATEPGFDGQAFGETTFGGDNWDSPPSSFGLATDELRTFMDQEEITAPDGTTVKKPYLDHEEFYYVLRLENPSDEQQKVTVRVFLAATELTDNRRMWIEMDKFAHILEPRQKTVVLRSPKDSSVVRKPARRPSDPRPQPEPGTVNNDYCDCGWPYHLLLPRGTEDGMPFRLLVMLTDWEADLVGTERECGSMSFCGRMNATYPDSKPMGYPFDRPFKERSIAETIAAQPNMATRDFKIRHTREA